MPATCLNEIDTVILAGGRGTRLQSLFPDRPKCLVPIDGVPFLRHYLNWLAKFGARRVILSLGHKADMVQAFLQSETWPGMEIEVHVESEPLGTGGAVRAVLPLLRSTTALVANGDSVTKANLCQFLEFHCRKHARASLLLTRQPDVTALGVVATDANDAVTAFTEKPTAPATGRYINAGIYLMHRDTIAEIPDTGNVSIEREVFPRLCGRGFYAFRGEFPFIDIGTPESYRRAAEFLAQEAA